MITTLYGADAKCGVTMICQEISQALAEREQGKTVLLLNLSGSTGTEYSNLDFSFSIDDIDIKLKSNVLTGEELISACSVQNNMYMLPGTKNLKVRKEYQPDEIIRLLELAKASFDQVIVDAGSSVDYGLNIGALLYSDRRILVTTQSKQAWRCFKQKNTQVLTPLDIRFDKLIINKFYMNAGIPGEKELAGAYEISDVDGFEMSAYGLQAENDGCRLSKIDRYIKKETQRLMTNIFFRTERKESKGFMGYILKGVR